MIALPSRGMDRMRVMATVALLGVLLVGCSSAEPAEAPASSEAIVGGLETVAPEDVAELSGQDLADVVESAGEYACEADVEADAGGDAAWTCRSQDGGAGVISIVGDEQASLSADGAIGADTLEALTAALGVDAAALADGSGLRWP
jgi:hypothetical protein